MELTVLGCHGGETKVHRTSAFMLNKRVVLDAGALTSMLTLEEQQKIAAVLVSHAHMDHVRDLATLADNRFQQGGPSIVVAASQGTIDSLRTHFFNGKLWPDFTKINTKDGPTVVFKVLEPEKSQKIAGFDVKTIPVHHTIETTAFVVDDGNSSIVYSGDTGPTERLWKVIEKQKNLKGLLMEVSFPNDHQGIAKASGHHTPITLAEELKKLHSHPDLPVMLFHIKPVFQAQVEKEIAKFSRSSLEVLKLGDHFSF
ncbi:MAG: 3',5'-cyclic-nucleotide phosphodiesterase [Myxococcales bacterium]|nr:MAG: 3',5'-cyclic-nucleotide phosphodiesterase [Myxococcales bacterium]